MGKEQILSGIGEDPDYKKKRINRRFLQRKTLEIFRTTSCIRFWRRSGLTQVYCIWCFAVCALQLQWSCNATTEFSVCSGCAPCSSSVHPTPGKMAAVPIYKVLVRSGRAPAPLTMCDQLAAATERHKGLGIASCWIGFRLFVKRPQIKNLGLTFKFSSNFCSNRCKRRRCIGE